MTAAGISSIIAIGGCLLGAGYLWGYLKGEKDGRDLQAVDDFIEAAQKDRARRDRDGKFKQLSGGTKPRTQPNGARDTVVDVPRA